MQVNTNKQRLFLVLVGYIWCWLIRDISHSSQTRSCQKLYPDSHGQDILMVVCFFFFLRHYSDNPALNDF